MTIQWGLLSTAHINRRVIPAIKQSGRGNLLGVASRNIEKAREYGAQWEIPKTYGSYEEMLNDDQIDVIYISLPNHLHTEWIIKSLEAGKHVLCEKPMCLSLDELDVVEKAVAKTGLTVMEGFMHLHHPQTQLWKAMIDRGDLGEIHSMRSSFTFNFDRSADNYRWNANEGGGALWDVGVYPISLFQFLFGSSSLKGNASIYIENGIDLSTSALLDYGEGRIGQFFVSFRSSYTTDTVIHGSEAQLFISHPFSNVDACKAYIRRGDDIEYLDVPREYLYSGEVENMHDIILEGKTQNVSLDVSRNVLKTVLQLKNI
ncbi:MAG TPA: Gfo/Idh/MocA family oxidoreductase [Saprospiraceae bacterium]|nr:Gfo/Idh/MocA family oxidoreductase [Saprospiraceae bacterium]